MSTAPTKHGAYDSTVCLERLRKLRDEKGDTQEDVAKHLHISRTTMVKIETGGRSISPDLLYSLAQYYGTSVDYLLGLTEVRRAGETLPACDELGLSDTATMVLEVLKDRGLSCRILSKIIEHNLFESFLHHVETSALSSDIDRSFTETNSNLCEIVASANAAGYAIIPAAQKKHYNVYMASMLMQSMIYDISETLLYSRNKDVDGQIEDGI